MTTTINILLLPLARALYRCPMPARVPPHKFQGTWGVGFVPGVNTAVNYLTANAFWAPSTPGDLVDTYFCLIDALVDAKTPNKLHVTFGRGNATNSCGSLDITTPESINWHMEWDATKCPADDGPLSYTGWKVGSAAPTCPSITGRLPEAMRGRASMTPAGYKDAFLHVDEHSWSLVNEGALVTGWCASRIVPLGVPEGVLEVQFCNNPDGSLFCVGGAASRSDASATRRDHAPPFAGFLPPGRACVWIRASSSASNAFDVKPGGLLPNGTAVCPTDMSDAVTLVFNVTGSAAESM